MRFRRTGSGAERTVKDALYKTDPSLVWVQFVRAKFVDDFSRFACPGDPFVAVPYGRDDIPDSVDLHSGDVIEGRPIPGDLGLTSPGSPAATLSGRTYFSYGMQAGNRNARAHLGPKLNPKIPVAADRNPWCPTITDEIRRREAVLDNSPTGNPWAHGRRGLNVAFTDGRALWMETADSLEMPTTGVTGSDVRLGLDYVYGSNPVGEAPPPVKGECHSLPEGTATTDVWTSWITD